MKKLLLFAATVMVSLSMMAEGAQSLQVAFNGFDNTNWEASVAASNQQVANGILSVTQELQANTKYRADIKFNKGNNGSNTFLLDPTRDVYVGIKFIGDKPEGALKFEFKHDNNIWCNTYNSPKGNISTEDGKIYYFLLTDNEKYTAAENLTDGLFTVRQMNIIIADNPNAEAITYQIDWIASFASLEDLEAAADWNDDITSSSAIFNARTRDGYTDLKEAVEAAAAGDVLVLNENITYSDSRLEIKKALTIQGANDTIRLISDVPAGQILVLANHNEEDYDVTFRNLIIDGQNIERSTQLLDANNHGRFVLENISIINTAYSVVAGDVKSSQREVVLGGNCSFATGIYLNGGKRVDGKNATHTAEHPIRLILHDDYKEDYAIVLNCNDSTLYTAVDAASQTGWELYVSGGKELKGRKVELPTGMEQSDIMNRASKIIRDGRIVIRRGEDLYDLSGQIIK